MFQPLSGQIRCVDERGYVHLLQSLENDDDDDVEDDDDDEEKKAEPKMEVLVMNT